MSGDHNRYCSGNRIETQNLTRQMKQRDDELFELHANAARYELMREMALYEMQVHGTLPVPIEESYDWFDAQIDATIMERYPNATIGKVE